MLNKKVGAYGEVWGEDFVLSDTWCLSDRGSIAFGPLAESIGSVLSCLFVPSWLLIKGPIFTGICKVASSSK